MDAYLALFEDTESKGPSNSMEYYVGATDFQEIVNKCEECYDKSSATGTLAFCIPFLTEDNEKKFKCLVEDDGSTTATIASTYQLVSPLIRNIDSSLCQIKSISSGDMFAT